MTIFFDGPSREGKMRMQHSASHGFQEMISSINYCQGLQTGYGENLGGLLDFAGDGIS
jgi:hypothetical protein